MVRGTVHEISDELQVRVPSGPSLRVSEKTRTPQSPPGISDLLTDPGGRPDKPLSGPLDSRGSMVRRNADFETTTFDYPSRDLPSQSRTPPPPPPPPPFRSPPLSTRICP